MSLEIPICRRSHSIMVTKILNYVQDDLLSEDMLILDTHSEVFIWIGQCVEAKDKQKAFDIGQVMIAHGNSFEKKLAILFRSFFILQSDDCQDAIPIIGGRMGIYLEGSVSPPLDGVNIRIIAAGDSIHSPLRTGDLALATDTGADGSFSAGPLFEDILYNVEASKHGYHVKQVGPNSFACQKLGKIVVNVHDGGETVGLFPSVLLSLSGEDGYRNNSVSGAGGTFIFDNLFPRSFYLRPVHKEFAFTPAAIAIDLTSGESKEVLFHAKRVVYSVNLWSAKGGHICGGTF